MLGSRACSKEGQWRVLNKICTIRHSSLGLYFYLVLQGSLGGAVGNK